MKFTEAITEDTETMTNNKTVKYNGLFIIGTLLLALTLAACEDMVIDLTPESTLTEANFFQTSEDINNAVIGVYDHYQSKLPNDWRLMEFPSDHLHISEYRGIAGLNPLGNLDFDPQNPRFNAFWTNAYNGIYRANSVLDHIDVPDNYRGNERAQYEAEARFMRAIYYFDLVRAFGGVPAITNRISASEAMDVGRASEDEIYSLIISDLQVAAENLPTQDATPLGRATAGAAEAFLGKVYVYLEEWQNALAHLQNVSGYGYELEDDFATLFSLEGSKNNSEFIFQMPYIEGVQSHGLSSNFIPFQGVEGISPRGGEDALISWDVHKKFDEADTRKDVTVTEYWRNPATPDEPEDWYPYVSKFAVPHQSFSSGLDLSVIRYAEVVLLRAEALYHLGNEAEALVELNRVRERGYGDSSHNYADASNFMDKLMLERQLELAFENERWFDLVRTGRMMDEMAEHEILYNPADGSVVTINRDPRPHFVRFPIPQHQIDQHNSGVLQQNEGY